METKSFLNRQAVKKKAALISLIIGFLMFFGKMGAYILTGSAAVLSDALESIVHIFATSFAFYSLHLSTKPPDKEHPYGHGKIEFFSAGFEGALIIIAAASIIIYAVKDIITGKEISKLDIGAAIIAGASLTNLFLGLYLINTGKKTNSLVLAADGKHVLTDSYTSIGAFIALILVLITDIKLFDPLIAILIALNILWTGIKLIRESVGGLMNETNSRIIGDIADAFEKERVNNPNWIDIHKLRYWKSGDKYMVDFHLIVPYYQSVKEGHETMNRLDKILKQVLKTNEVESFIHLDPCNPKCCYICSMPDCKARHEQKSKQILWDGAKIISRASYDIDEIT
jgi:cation diffusion facilitator family transporter